MPKFVGFKFMLPWLCRAINELPNEAPLPYLPFQRKLIGSTVNNIEVIALVVGAIKQGVLRAAVLFVHGGGFLAGTAMASLRCAQHIAITHNCVAVVLDYSLAPEAKFPIARDELCAAFDWVRENAEWLGIDVSRIALIGESAGGGHAAMLTHYLKAGGKATFICQVLGYPMIDDRTGSTRKVPDHVGRVGWSARLNCLGWISLLGMPAASTLVPVGAVSALESDFSDFPTTFIGVGDIDLFHEEVVIYARNLGDASARVELIVVHGAFHGFDRAAPQASCSQAFIARRDAFLTKSFAEN